MVHKTLAINVIVWQRKGPYLQSCQWGFNLGKLKFSQIAHTVVLCENRSLYTYISTLEGQGSISCGQYLDRTFGKFPPLYGPHRIRTVSVTVEMVTLVEITNIRTTLIKFGHLIISMHFGWNVLDYSDIF